MSATDIGRAKAGDARDRVRERAWDDADSGGRADEDAHGRGERVGRAQIAAGIGCRRGCDVREIVQAIERALKAAGQDVRALEALYAPEFKRDELGIARAADHFGKRLVFLPLAALQAQAPRAHSASEHTQKRFGVPSIAETAALAGAGAACCSTSASQGVARLLGPRELVGGASCALAVVIAESVT